MKRVAILGSALSGGAGQIIEALQGSKELVAELILDNDLNAIGKMVFGVEVKGSTAQVLDFWREEKFDAAIIAIGGNLNERKKVFEKLKENQIPTVNVIDESVKMGLNVIIGTGNVILNNSYFGNNVQLEDNNYILNQCSIQHDSKIGSHNYFATNVIVGAKVKIGNENRFKIKSIVETGSSIGSEIILESLEIKKS